MKSELECDALVARVKKWLGRSSCLAISQQVGIDEKSVRNAKLPEWNPRVSTLRKFEVAFRRGADGEVRPRRKAAA